MRVRHRFYKLLKAILLYDKLGFTAFKFYFSLGDARLTLPNGGEISIRKDTSDLQAFAQIFIDESYNINLQFNPETIIDCGANIGCASVYFKLKYPNVKLIAIEPENSNFKSLECNLKPYSNVYLEKKGLWSKQCNIKIIDESVDSWAYCVQETDEQSDLSAISIVDIIEKYGLKTIDILKIDIEGSEKEIFSHPVDQWLPLVKVLIIELHDRMIPDCSKCFFHAISNYSYNMEISNENIICYFNH